MRGLFITLEGIEGCGKTTQMERLAGDLIRRGFKVLKTREPGGTRFGEQIRKILLDQKNDRMDPRTELFLYLASRSQHREDVIVPALKQGKIVLCDRFSDATLAYQGFGRKLNGKVVRTIVDYAAKSHEPDMTLLLDLDVRKGLARVMSRGKVNRMDREKLSFHRRVRSGYLRLAEKARRRIRVIDASQEIAVVTEEIHLILEPLLQRYSRRS